MSLLFEYRVRDEINMTIAAYQILYESSVAFGMRKSLMSEQGKLDMEENIERLEKEKKDLEKQVKFISLILVMCSCSTKGERA